MGTLPTCLHCDQSMMKALVRKAGVDVCPAPGARAGNERIRNVLTVAGFARLRRATRMPFNLVFETPP